MGGGRSPILPDSAEFQLVVDHVPLLWLTSMKDRNPRVLCWYISLLPFCFTVRHQAGRNHQVADYLSRLFKEDPAAAGERVGYPIPGAGLGLPVPLGGQEDLGGLRDLCAPSPFPRLPPPTAQSLTGSCNRGSGCGWESLGLAKEPRRCRGGGAMQRRRMAWQQGAARRPPDPLHTWEGPGRRRRSAAALQWAWLIPGGGPADGLRHTGGEPRRSGMRPAEGAARFQRRMGGVVEGWGGVR